MTYKSSGYLPTLDGWRAVAILCVMASHVALWSPRPTSVIARSVWLYVRTIGDNGVEIFFCLSGFLITSLLLREYQENKSVCLRAFYVRRVARIAPAALTYLASISLLSAFGPVPVGWKEMMASVLFLRNYIVPVFGTSCWFTNHFWSLSVEEHFYFIWPTVLALTRFRARLTAILAIAAVVVWRAVNSPMKPAFLFHTDARMDALLLGALAALCYPALERLLPRGRFWLIATALTYIASEYFITQTNGSFARLAREASVVAAIVVCLSNDHALVPKLLEWQPLRWIGRLSYSLYLWQQLFLNHYFYEYRLWEVPVRVATTFLCAYLSYRFVEKPLIRIGQARSTALIEARKNLGRALFVSAGSKGPL